MIVIAAIVKVNRGRQEEFEREFLMLRPKVLNDPGALGYALHRSTDDPCKYFVYEKYENDEALKYHMSTAHFKTFFQKLEPLMTGQPEVGYYQEVN
jgi:quinol monooxygenase YgiN